MRSRNCVLNVVQFGVLFTVKPLNEEHDESIKASIVFKIITLIFPNIPPYSKMGYFGERCLYPSSSVQEFIS